MIDLLKKLGGNKPDPNDPTIRLQEEVRGMELKKQTLISSVQNEINAATQKMDAIFLEIGKESYSAHCNGTEFAPHNSFEAIKAQEQLIAEKQAKIKEISDRYDEELNMLRTHLSSAVPTSGGDTSCGGCGKPYNPSVDAFCMGCGKKLSE
jgi:hypothetical protein